MIRDALHAYAATQVKTWAHDRSQTVGASEIGQCARRVFYVKNEGDAVFGSERDKDHEDGWGFQLRGTVFENVWWVPAMRARFGEKLLFAGEDQRTIASGFLSATTDALIVGLESDALAGLGVPDIGSDCIVADCKTADPRTDLAEPKAEHVLQIQVQLGLARRRTNYRPVYGLLSYTNASDWADIVEFPIRFDEPTFERALSRATEIMTARAASDLRPEGYIAGGKECDHCPFAGPCGQARADAVPKNDAVVNGAAGDEIAALGAKAKASRAKAEMLLEDARATEQEIKDALSQAGSRKASGSIEGASITVSWAALKGRPSWDMKRLREAAAAAGVDLSQFETTGDPSDRLVITAKEKTQ